METWLEDYRIWLGKKCVLLADVDGHEYIWKHGRRTIGVDLAKCVHC